MRIIAHKTLIDFYSASGNENSKAGLEHWYMVAKSANWNSFNDIRKDFPSADYVGNQHYVFNISGNNFRLIVVIKFVPKTILIRWVGRHSDYDKIDCRTI